MGRVLWLLFLVAALATSGYTLVGHMRKPARSAGPAQLAQLKDASLELEAAGRALETAHRLFGTYADTDLKIFKGLTVARAADSSYCIQVVRDGASFHQAGPGGAPAPGGC